jgi:hypothetical protein
LSTSLQSCLQDEENCKRAFRSEATAAPVELAPRTMVLWRPGVQPAAPTTSQPNDKIGPRHACTLIGQSIT